MGRIGREHGQRGATGGQPTLKDRSPGFVGDAQSDKRKMKETFAPGWIAEQCICQRLGFCERLRPTETFHKGAKAL